MDYRFELTNKDIACKAAISMVNFQQKINEVEYLHPSELQYYNTLQFEARQQSYLYGRIAAKHALGLLDNTLTANKISIRNALFEFPILDTIGSLDISISHCNDMAVAIAFDRAYPMAIDIEQINSAKLDTIQDQLTVAEISLIQRSDLELSSALTLMWTAKEALSKVLRCGLLVEFRLLEVAEIKQELGVVRLSYTNFSQYSVLAYKIGDRWLSIVYPKMLNVIGLPSTF